MWLSTRTRYGLKAIYEIGLNYDDKPISLNSISTKHGISLNYLEQIIAILKKDQLIKSTRGPRGGYSLMVEPTNITLGQIIRSLEGNFTPTECVDTDGQCKASYNCVSFKVFEKMNNSLSDVVDNITLQNMIDGDI